MPYWKTSLICSGCLPAFVVPSIALLSVSAVSGFKDSDAVVPKAGPLEVCFAALEQHGLHDTFPELRVAPVAEDSAFLVSCKDSVPPCTGQFQRAATAAVRSLSVEIPSSSPNVLFYDSRQHAESATRRESVFISRRRIFYTAKKKVTSRDVPHLSGCYNIPPFLIYNHTLFFALAKLGAS